MEINNLIKSCIKGNPVAEKQLFARYARKVFTICSRYVSQEAEAKDLMQDCFIRVFDKLKLYDADKGEFEAWLHRVCTNVILRKIQEKKRAVSFVYPETFPELEEEIDENEFSEISNEMLLAGIQELPEGCRQILNLYIFEGVKHRSIAAYLNISEGTSRSQYKHAKKLLKVILQKKIKNNNWYYERRLA